MTEEQGSMMDQNEFMKRMKAIASDLWGSVVPAEEEEPPEPQQKEKPLVQEPVKPNFKNTSFLRWRSIRE